ncbi:DegV family protein, partial [Clostridioides difficile]
MDKIKLIVDSACDLPDDIIEKYNIEVVGLNVSFGEESYISGKEI